ncbi:hypothetical protein HZH68_006100 [Vespula germanica]|uniref:Uncharacterized protein n=1 Tax=Vespula germanica TaxID=30212 RepID=A0A834KG47_VESGE|nr:hypothetical protein HZH68_006100 [Vespula germanica]
MRASENVRIAFEIRGPRSEYISVAVRKLKEEKSIHRILNEASNISELRIRILGVSSTRLLGDRATTSNYIGLVSPGEEEENCENTLRSKGHRPDNLPTNLAN